MVNSQRSSVLIQSRVKLFVDAEHTWYQPALDAYTVLLSEKFNRSSEGASLVGPLI